MFVAEVTHNAGYCEGVAISVSLVLNHRTAGRDPEADVVIGHFFGNGHGHELKPSFYLVFFHPDKVKPVEKLLAAVLQVLFGLFVQLEGDV